MWRTLIAVLLLLLIALPLSAAVNQPVKVEGGLLTGVPGKDPSVTVFKGIPYAAPPLGEMRWKTAAPAAGWKGVRKADAFGPSCIQSIVQERKPWTYEFMTHTEISEDCLSLNVWTAAVDPFEAVRFFVGQWEGTGSGEPGQSVVQRKYQFVMDEHFLQVKNVSRWAPDAKNPKGETHEDFGIISYDKARKTIVYRQFHVDGFVNQYAMEVVRDPKIRVFVSEAIENIAPGWRARETYHILSHDQFEEVFELAAPGKDFELYSRTRLRRKR